MHIIGAHRTDHATINRYVISDHFAVNRGFFADREDAAMNVAVGGSVNSGNRVT